MDVGLWAGFGGTLRFSMNWLVAQPWRGFVGGAMVGPMVYSGGRTLWSPLYTGTTASLNYAWALIWAASRFTCVGDPKRSAATLEI